jgi:AraC family transcriptional regulator
MTKLYIKNMVCPRCIKVVREELEKLNLTPLSVKLGEVELAESEDKIDSSKIEQALLKEGFELLGDSNAKLIESIKTTIINAIRGYKKIDLSSVTFSTLLSGELGKEYTSLSSLFSKVESITIEQYIILQKIEMAKELLTYGELTLSEIAYLLGYSSVQHLSRQFKRVTGMTASNFAKKFSSNRKPIDKLIDN